jgi:hypothetical protein
MITRDSRLKMNANTLATVSPQIFDFVLLHIYNNGHDRLTVEREIYLQDLQLLIISLPPDLQKQPKKKLPLLYFLSPLVKLDKIQVEQIQRWKI